MDLLTTSLLAFVQGITEFLPVSSTAHLILFSHLTGAQNQSLVLDIAVHFGTLFATLFYFRHDVIFMFWGGIDLLKGKITPGTILMFKIIVAVIPVVIAGYWIKKLNMDALSTLRIIAICSIIFGALLGLADYFVKPQKTIDQMSYLHAFLIGLFQILALIPGVSRSGMTMMTARLCGYNRPDSARFSFLLAIPTVLGASLLGAIDIYKSPDILPTTDLLVGIGISCFIGILTVSWVMKWLKHHSYLPFAVYRVLLGSAILLFL